MTIQVTGKNIDIGESLRQYVVEKITIAIEKYVETEISGHIRIEKERNHFVTNCSTHLKSGLALQSHGEAHDAYGSVDAAIERLEKRLRRYKRRLVDRHQLGAPRGNVDQATVATDYVLRAEDGTDGGEAPDDHTPLIVAETATTIRELSVSDAVMQMDLADAPVLVFRNAGHGRINVVYRRKDGNIGWIDPSKVET